MNRLGMQSKVYWSPLNLRPAFLCDIFGALILALKARHDRFDALVFHQGQAASILFSHSRTICYFHQVKYYDLAHSGFLGNLYRNLLVRLESHCDKIVCNSMFTASLMHAVSPRSEIEVVYPGSSVEQSRIKDPVSRPGLSCYYHSRFTPRKNQEFLLRVFEQLPFELCLTGGAWDPAFRSYQRKIVRKSSTMRNVRVNFDVTEELQQKLLAECDVFLFPANIELFGLALLEAMALGKPIIAMDSGASREVLGNAGVLCIQDEDQWRKAIYTLSSNHDPRRVSREQWISPGQKLQRL